MDLGATTTRRRRGSLAASARGEADALVAALEAEEQRRSAEAEHARKASALRAKVREEPPLRPPLIAPELG